MQGAFDLVEASEVGIVGIDGAAPGHLVDTAGEFGQAGGDRREVGGIGIHAPSVPGGRGVGGTPAGPRDRERIQLA